MALTGVRSQSLCSFSVYYYRRKNFSTSTLQLFLAPFSPDLMLMRVTHAHECHFLGIDFYPNLNDNKKINHDKDTEQPNELPADVCLAIKRAF